MAKKAFVTSCIAVQKGDASGENPTVGGNGFFYFVILDSNNVVDPALQTTYAPNFSYSSTLASIRADVSNKIKEVAGDQSTQIVWLDDKGIL